MEEGMNNLKRLIIVWNNLRIEWNNLRIICVGLRIRFVEWRTIRLKRKMRKLLEEENK